MVAVQEHSLEVASKATKDVGVPEVRATTRAAVLDLDAMRCRSATTELSVVDGDVAEALVPIDGGGH